MIKYDKNIELDKCSRKVKFTESGAREEAHRLRDKNTGLNTLRVFECQICGMWHVGKIKKPQKPKKRRKHEYQVKGERPDKIKVKARKLPEKTRLARKNEW